MIEAGCKARENTAARSLRLDSRSTSNLNGQDT